ncbi:MAG: efflux RND transporter periplasmic adaptor subunit [Rudanella sp.]|nr:efflux RND transporter periplasmic adaptor subunit [Rudanella sp.]
MSKLTPLVTFLGLFVLLANSPLAMAHGGEDHGAATAPTGKAVAYFTSQAISDKYELVLHYEPLEAGEAGKLRLYINEFNTNRPVEGATLKLSSPEEAKLTIVVKPIGKGIYELSGTFPAKKRYSLTVSLNAGPGADLLLLPGIEVGKDLPVSTVAAPIVGPAHWYESPYLLLGGGLLLGMGLMFLLMRTRNRRVSAAVVVLFCLLPTAHWQRANAHGGEDHGAAASGGGATSSTFAIPKETQFLFNILTQRLVAGEQALTTTVAGTVIPSSTGQAVVQSPQVGRLTSLLVRVGQSVSKGQTLALVEQTIDAATQINLQAERNTLQAELQVARKEFDRLKTIEDIVAKRDLTEAEARLNRAQANLKVFTSIAQGGRGNARSISLKAPVGGIVGPFTAAIGATVNVGETLFTITNLGKIYIEAQVFDKDLAVLRQAKSFGVEGVNDAGKRGVARLLSQAQTVNASNQSQRLLFEMDNGGGAFKIGEFVTIRVQSARGTRGLSVPNAALSEMNGKSVVFIKDAPEVVSLAYVTTGADNGQFTQILSGVEADERVIVSGTYQAKMIYLNQ